MADLVEASWLMLDMRSIEATSEAVFVTVLLVVVSLMLERLVLVPIIAISPTVAMASLSLSIVAEKLAAHHVADCSRLLYCSRCALLSKSLHDLVTEIL